MAVIYTYLMWHFLNVYLHLTVFTARMSINVTILFGTNFEPLLPKPLCCMC